MTAQSFAWTPKDLRELEANYFDELSAEWVYNRLAEIDDNEARAADLRQLAEYEKIHADAWKSVMEKIGHPVPRKKLLLENKFIVTFAKLFGITAVVSVLHKMEVDGIAKYKSQQERWQDPAAQAALKELMPQEVAHEVDLFNEMRKTSRSGGVLRSVILGANDGFGSTLALVAGVAGATASSSAVLIAGLAGLVAGSVSMAASNYVSVKAEQEIVSSQTRLEGDAIKFASKEKRKQLREAYMEKGLTEQESDAVVSRLSTQPDQFLNAILTEEHGITEASVEKPFRLSIFTGIAFALAAAVPIIPFLFLGALEGVIAAIVFTLIALFISGIIRALSTLKPFLRSGVEMVLIGMGASAATYVVGIMLGTVVG